MGYAVKDVVLDSLTILNLVSSSVACLLRDVVDYQTIGIGTTRYISHERCINNALLLATKRLAERQNLTDIAYRPFSSHRNALQVVTNLCLSTRETAHMRNLNFRYHLLLLLLLQANDLAPRRKV